ncbi:hypothetical protein IKF63_01180 [Candidatus Saccharibacteria bacterium]|nr:hypothetical protein [Candidatus Saccharibacteria bacterium]MBR3180676.1 hypothetical protein [Candidatus Saccharibacteria bacterium]
MLEIFEPRYRDRVVLAARYKITPGYPVKLRIKKGAYKGDWVAPSSVVAKSPVEKMKTKAGALIEMKAIPLDSLERAGA